MNAIAVIELEKCQKSCLTYRIIQKSSLTTKILFMHLFLHCTISDVVLQGNVSNLFLKPLLNFLFIVLIFADNSHLCNRSPFTTQSQLLTNQGKKPFENIEGKGENLVASSFSFFTNVSAILKTNSTIFVTFNPFLSKPWFSRVWSTSLLETLLEKEKLLVASSFSFSHNVFYPF